MANNDASARMRDMMMSTTIILTNLLSQSYLGIKSSTELILKMIGYNPTLKDVVDEFV